MTRPGISQDVHSKKPLPLRMFDINNATHNPPTTSTPASGYPNSFITTVVPDQSQTQQIQNLLNSANGRQISSTVQSIADSLNNTGNVSLISPSINSASQMQTPNSQNAGISPSQITAVNIPNIPSTATTLITKGEVQQTNANTNNILSAQNISNLFANSANSANQLSNETREALNLLTNSNNNNVSVIANPNEPKTNGPTGGETNLEIVDTLNQVLQASSQASKSTVLESIVSQSQNQNNNQSLRLNDQAELMTDDHPEQNSLPNSGNNNNNNESSILGKINSSILLNNNESIVTSISDAVSALTGGVNWRVFNHHNQASREKPIWHDVINQDSPSPITQSSQK